MQLLLFPDSLADAEEDEAALPKGPQLPKVAMTAKPEELRAAFKVAERIGRQEGAKAVAATAAAAAVQDEADAAAAAAAGRDGPSGSSSSSS